MVGAASNSRDLQELMHSEGSAPQSLSCES